MKLYTRCKNLLLKSKKKRNFQDEKEFGKLELSLELERFLKLIIKIIFNSANTNLLNTL